MEYFEAPPSYVKNCLMTPKKPNELLFTQQGELAVAHLDGYAVIPIEEYNALKVYKDLWVASVES